MRLFIALDVEEYYDYFSSLQSQLPKEYAKFNFTKSFHLTFKFLGDVMPQYIENYKKALQEISFKPFTIHFSKAGFFSPRDIHVVWIGLQDNRKIMKLQSQIDNSLRKYFPKTERYHPHVTLARVKSVYDRDALKKSIQTLPVKDLAFKVNGFKLMMSTLTSLGPIYEEIETFNDSSE
ncbi:MAG: RNA 2',3'-cyclic phosphodiesterase [Candidatus Woesearchaeota archaeon]|jgi:2'-5' RNA ligase|nr:RNA 2',3'-cyclic phosphodiesterase [Candidatus Woesearchaeota archaeon]MDP7323208.1 RNA 2',3'-cyclic phosphodiesterase [Candidatus Woesearchaeota archaeon]MDP7458423.1 RNA 2',3'-cyclic phosphodiesterase [Candidatus Woesearchaeota archaeon]